MINRNKLAYINIVAERVLDSLQIVSHHARTGWRANNVQVANVMDGTTYWMFQDNQKQWQCTRIIDQHWNMES